VYSYYKRNVEPTHCGTLLSLSVFLSLLYRCRESSNWKEKNKKMSGARGPERDDFAKLRWFRTDKVGTIMTEAREQV
jgi:hypothetical protein